MSTDETQPASGSRWEQPDDKAPQPAATQPAAEPTEPTPAYTPAPPPNRNRGRLLLAGGAVGVALVAGSGGFALGHATAGDGRDGAGLRGPGFGTNGGPGFGVPGNGQQQQQPPGFRDGQDRQDGQDGTFPDDRDGDDSDLPDDGSTQGSSNT